MKERPAHDISIRLPKGKKHLKRELMKVAAKNEMTLTVLMISVIEWFLEERKDREFAIKLR